MRLEIYGCHMPNSPTAHFGLYNFTVWTVVVCDELAAQVGGVPPALRLTGCHGLPCIMSLRSAVEDLTGYLNQMLQPKACIR